MANKDAAKKALRADARKAERNSRRKRVMKEAEKSVRRLAATGKTKEAQEILPKAYKAIDKAAKSGVIKRNAASRKKSRLTKAVNKSS